MVCLNVCHLFRLRHCQNEHYLLSSFCSYFKRKKIELCTCSTVKAHQDSTNMNAKQFYKIYTLKRFTWGFTK